MKTEVELLWPFWAERRSIGEEERETGSLEPKEYGGGRSHAIKDGRQLNRLKKIIESQADAAIAEITAKKIKAYR